MGTAFLVPRGNTMLHRTFQDDLPWILYGILFITYLLLKVASTIEDVQDARTARIK